MSIADSQNIRAPVVERHSNPCVPSMPCAPMVRVWRISRRHPHSGESRPLAHVFTRSRSGCLDLRIKHAALGILRRVSSSAPSPKRSRQVFSHDQPPDEGSMSKPYRESLTADSSRLKLPEPFSDGVDSRPASSAPHTPSGSASLSHAL
jgi:hypothetical protein